MFVDHKDAVSSMLDLTTHPFGGSGKVGTPQVPEEFENGTPIELAAVSQTASAPQISLVASLHRLHCVLWHLHGEWIAFNTICRFGSLS